MCTHALSNENDVEGNWQPTDREFLEFFSSERAYVIQHWRGTDDFFFCHWMAESEDDILRVLEAEGCFQHNCDNGK